MSVESHSRRQSTESSPNNNTLPATSPRHAIEQDQTAKPVAPHAPSGEYDMSLIGGAPLTITQAAVGVTPIAPGPPVKSAGGNGATTARRRPAPLRATPAPAPGAGPPSPTHKKTRPPREHKPDDLLRSWRRDDSPSPHLTQDDTKMSQKETKMSNINYTRGRRGSIDDIVISHHTDESATNVDIATSPQKNKRSLSATQPTIGQLDEHDMETLTQLTMSPSKHTTRTRTPSGTKSAQSSPYITTRSHIITPSALMLTPTHNATASRVRWLLRGIIVTLLSLMLYSYTSSHSPLIILFWFLLIPLSIWLVAQHTTQQHITTTTTTTTTLTDSPLINKGIKGRRRSSNPALQNLSLRNSTLPPLSSSTTSSISTPTSPVMEMPSVLLQRKHHITEERPHRTKLPTNVFLHT